MQQILQQALDLIAKDDSNKLILRFGGKTIARGEKVSKELIQSPPELQLTGPSGTHVAVAIDIDAPYGSAPFLSPILHWIQPGLKAMYGGLLKAEETCLVEWLAPIPPPLSAPHRYVVMLFEQPDGFEITAWEPKFPKPMGIPSRCRWSVDGFAREAGLKMVAANDFCN